MNKKDILGFLDKYLKDKNEFIVISGAALVIQGVKEKTNDIDIAVSIELYNKLLNEYNCGFEKKIGKYYVWFIEGIINFSVHYYDNTEYIVYNGYKVQTLDFILNLKKSLNRDKDKSDIEKILHYKTTQKKFN